MTELKRDVFIAFTILALQSCSYAPNKSQQNVNTKSNTDDTTDSFSLIDVMLTSKLDSTFAITVGSNGLADVEYAKLAIRRVTNPKLRAVASLVMTDQIKLNDELLFIAKNKNIKLDLTLHQKHQKVFGNLNQLIGRDFDEKYIDIVIDCHQNTLVIAEKEINEGTDKELRAFANKTSAMAKSHLKLIKVINSASR